LSILIGYRGSGALSILKSPLKFQSVKRCRTASVPGASHTLN
jgi:hypothetical protein